MLAPGQWLLRGMLLIAATVPAAAQDTLTELRAGGSVRIAVADEEPYGYRNAEGEITGEAAEIARAILQRLAPGAGIEWTVTPFGSLIDGLREERFDIVAAGMFITPERCQLVAFSDPTYVVGEAFVVQAGNPLGLTNYYSIAENEQVRIGLLAGTVEYNYAYVAGIPAERGLIYTTFAEATEALLAGEIDAIGVTALTANALADDHPELAATEQFFPVVDGQAIRGYGAFAFRPSDQALVEAFNTVLDDYLGSEAHWQTVEPFGFGPDMLPERSASELCQGAQEG
ncbi:MAG: ectoine/hydroxyectoine ABC transporter substrate-binding protein EhuB [Candidatus Competibacterales bacterium]|nr:ectoine/hydroxyectoine ABC transporter substrate-binding protein EhuB [Candidatus Competibacterales bacterium]